MQYVVDLVGIFNPEGLVSVLTRFLKAAKNVFTGGNSESLSFYVGVVITILVQMGYLTEDQAKAAQTFFFGYTGMRVYTKSVGPAPGANP